MRKLRPQFWAALALIITPACTTLPSDYPKSRSTAFQEPEATTFGAIFEREAARHPGESGFKILADNRPALTNRIALADFAEETLDIQYYIWSRDTIGHTLSARVLRAADRGVRVRFLLDDINFKDRDSGGALLSSHPNIEVRIFNPHLHRSARPLELVGNFRRLNKRMHNKIMVMDNACAIVGGRNIANEYFGLNPDFNMRDLDVLAAGPIVREISDTFDEFWNSRGAVPIEVLADESYDNDDLQDGTNRLNDYLAANPLPFPIESDLKAIQARGSEIARNLSWAPAEILHDSIDSMEESGSGKTVAAQLRQEIRNVKKEMVIESAYFVLEKRGLKAAETLCDRGIHLRVLTNSLASNDVVAAQAGHRQNLKKLLRSGVDLYEFRPDAEVVRSQAAPTAKKALTSLHTKTLVLDGERSFIGSYNLDPRSANINSEIGILVRSKSFAEKVRAYLDQGVDPTNAYHLTLDRRNRPEWSTIEQGEQVTWSKDPETSAFRRFTASFLGLLPIDSQL